ncbi:carbohydrate esterase family 8 protein [Aplosporella prunicola CBS 121167]|uniref:Pectinesterase n=1 Tax=Aplosporella prunicola CBS 121167 TaxID=1176127 RepID=A0A6A6B0Z4_9PEZI|nr:carbohydrate esterase family 8 protein [Aplosporella prunicola CBS 121167]KAF2136697.1 carbohydrate esterase family 8 protein [Aplosporella prunicola CBS 121167]
MRLSLILSLVTSALALTSPPSGALTVGSGGTYSTIQQAVNKLSTSTTSSQYIFVYPGTYKEQVTIPALRGPLNFYGYSTSDSSYAANEVTITYGLSQADGLNNDGTATLRAHSPNFSMYNVNVANTYGKGSQAVALSAYSGGNQAFYGCKFTGYQDTLLAQDGQQFYGFCYIEGATDFIFGQHAAAWFQSCDIGVVSASKGYVTANGRSSSGSSSYYVINKGSIGAASGQSVSAGAYYLGRPWGNYARVVVQQTSLSNVINSAGWTVWNSGDERTDHVTFAEYGNSGDGASGSRASFATKLSSAVSISSVLSGYSSWVDSKYL